jgi:hypothetical protein
VTVTAVGGPVIWSASGPSPIIVVGGQGTLDAGRSDTVSIQLDRSCTGSGSGTVSFSPNGAVAVSWTCPTDGGPPGGQNPGGGN